MTLPIHEVSAFLSGRTLLVIDPETRATLGKVTYNGDGTCHAVMDGGQESPGNWGLTENGYWTQYTHFREGKRHAFTLVRVGGDMAQAYFADGRRAFLQAPDRSSD